MKIIKKIVKWIFILIALFLLYVIISIAYGTATDFQPEETVDVKVIAPSEEKRIDKATLTFLNWNIGYAGLGAKSNFFYDDGGFFFSGDKMVRSNQALVEEYLKGIEAFIENHQTDFILLQEVDRSSRRSHYIDEMERIADDLEGYTQTFAPNFMVDRVPIPICEPFNVIGKVHSGLVTYGKYTAQKSTRYQFPGEYSWPNRIFHLDRCMMVNRYQTIHPDGKELVIVNTHNSAYDGGKLKKQEMAYFKDFVLSEYEKGNYVIVGGDWNQCPPNVSFDYNAKALGIETDSTYNAGNISEEFLPEGWTWAVDKSVPTNRKLVNTYEKGETFVTLIDYYVVSPNVKVKMVEGKDLDFQYSDHQPVLMTVELDGLAPKVDTTAVDTLLMDS